MENEENIRENRSSISNAISYEEIGEFWDEHDTTDYWEQTYPVEFTINLREDDKVIYYGIDEALSAKVLSLAQRKGITPKELINLWIKEKLQEEIA